MDSLQPIPFRQLIDRVIPVLRRHFLTAFPSTAALLAVAGVSFIVAYHRLFTTIASADPSMIFGYLGAFMVAVLLGTVLYVVAYSALAVAAMEVVLSGGPMQLGRAWRRVLTPRLLWTILLSSCLLYTSPSPRD